MKLPWYFLPILPQTKFLFVRKKNHFARKSTPFFRKRKFGIKLYLTVAKNENCNFLCNHLPINWSASRFSRFYGLGQTKSILTIYEQKKGTKPEKWNNVPITFLFSRMPWFPDHCKILILVCDIFFFINSGWNGRLNELCIKCGR